MLEIKSVLCPIAGSEESNLVLDAALDIANRHGAKLTVLNVAPLRIIDLMKPRDHLAGGEDLLPSQVEERLERHSAEVLARAREHLAGSQVEFTRIMGHPGNVICDLVEQKLFDLVVIGHRKHSPVQRMFLGSVSDYVVHNCPCHVLVVKLNLNAESP